MKLIATLLLLGFLAACGTPIVRDNDKEEQQRVLERHMRGLQ